MPFEAHTPRRVRDEYDEPDRLLILGLDAIFDALADGIRAGCVTPDEGQDMYVQILDARNM